MRERTSSKQDKEFKTRRRCNKCGYRVWMSISKVGKKTIAKCPKCLSTGRFSNKK